ncbi:hypothetical protein BH11PAT3_BH11PAT3_1220 [soil metagenome]
MRKLGNKVSYHPRVVEQDIPYLDNSIRRRIQNAIETRLSMNGELYGASLRGSLKDFRKLRVGDWRVIYRMEHAEIVIWAIGHRKEVYRIATKRTKNTKI